MLTPQDIEDKVFSSAFMGYSREEVNLFLEELVTDYRKLTEENATLLKKLGILVEKVDEYRKDERYLREAIVNAQKISEVSSAQAEQRARRLVEEAESKAAEKLQTARFEGESVVSEAERESERIIKEAKEKADKLSAYSEESIARAKERYEALQREVTEFRTSLFNKYREHIEFIKDLPVFEELEEPEESVESGESGDLPQAAPEPPQPPEPDADTIPPKQLGFIQDDTEPEDSPEREPFKQPETKTDEKPAPPTEQPQKEPQHPKTRFENIKFGIDYDISAE